MIKLYVNRTKNIIVIGSGLAGLSAAIEAYKCGHNVTIIEKESNIGGNSIKASSGINSITDLDDSYELFYKDTIKSGKYTNQMNLTSQLVYKNKDAIQWLRDFGIDFNVVVKCGGHSVARTHSQNYGSVGFNIISKLKEYIKNSGIKVEYNTKVIELIHKENKVVGIRTGIKEIYCDVVILATGGYSYDKNGLLKEFKKDVMNLPTTNGKFALGEGIKMARKIGAKLIDMDKVQIHPTCFVKDNILAPESFRGCGGLLLNEKWERFCNELDTRDIVSDAIFKHCKDGKAILLMSEESVEKFGKEKFKFYLDKKLFEKCNDYYIAIVTPAIHYTMGGINIDENARVLDMNGNVIKNLYAAGEVTGGVHGSNRLAGNSLLECVVFGRIAGKINKNET